MFHQLRVTANGTALIQRIEIVVVKRSGTKRLRPTQRNLPLHRRKKITSFFYIRSGHKELRNAFVLRPCLSPVLKRTSPKEAGRGSYTVFSYKRCRNIRPLCPRLKTPRGAHGGHRRSPRLDAERITDVAPEDRSGKTDSVRTAGNSKSPPKRILGGPDSVARMGNWRGNSSPSPQTARNYWALAGFGR